MIANIGELAIYNGNINHLKRRSEKIYIKNKLEIGKSYKIKEVHMFSDGYWYKVNYKNIWLWAPMECFDIDLKKRYGLK